MTLGVRGRILAAEDNAVNKKLIARLLEKAGYMPTRWTNGHEAVEAVTRVEYDVVLMDCQMPEMDGFEATSVIRAAKPAGAAACRSSRSPRARCRAIASAASPPGWTTI